MNQKEITKVGVFGAVAGLATPLLLKHVIMPVLNWIATVIPSVSLKLAEPSAISISVRESLTGINGGLTAWLADALGFTATIPYQNYVYAAIGGALFFVLGAYALESLDLLKGDKVAKTRAVIFAGSAIAWLILGGIPQLNIGLANTLIAFVINAALLAWVYTTIDDSTGIGLIPF